MAEHNETGNAGEEYALRFLKQQGYDILETNWRFSRAEVDIVAKEGAVLVFVEVKTRSYDYFGTPDAFVTPRKEQLLADAAAAYMRMVKHDWEFRFDIIAITLQAGEGVPTIVHYRDAFFPGL